MAYVIVLIVLAVAVYVISAPLRAERGQEESAAEESRVAELEAARDAKYHEIRDAELDLRTGKLSDEDYEAVDRALRGEAIEIMRALDAVEAQTGAVTGESDAPAQAFPGAAPPA
jgi:flagellar biosynthesis/type III secretory pathway M-ring protein FliF/YscJ